MDKNPIRGLGLTNLHLFDLYTRFVDKIIFFYIL